MKKTISLAIGLLFLSIVCVLAVFAQETAPKMIRAGIINGRATKLPTPAYPQDAKRDGASGRVSVDVTVDEMGNVIAAKAQAENEMPSSDAAGGTPVMRQVHPALQEAAEKAAWQARFSPTKLSGRPIKVIGVISYNFVLDGEDIAPSGTASKPRIPSGGVLNGIATSLPVPVYTEAAKAARAEGIVEVQVVIDEAGNVISATAASGHPILRAGAVDAAYEAKFPPTVFSGQPVKVSGILVYYFKAEGDENIGKTAPEAPVDGGVLSSKAVSLPMPVYPPAAKAVRAGGAVSVYVVIDEQGNVVTATAVSGNPLLRSSAVAAAQEAKFPPTLLEGKPSTVSGILVYNFVPGDAKTKDRIY